MLEAEQPHQLYHLRSVANIIAIADFISVFNNHHQPFLNYEPMLESCNAENNICEAYFRHRW